MPPGACGHSQGVALSQQARVCAFPSFSTVDDNADPARVSRAARRKWTIDSGVGKPIPTAFGFYSHFVTVCKIGSRLQLCETRVRPSTGTQLHAFEWRSNGSGPKYCVCASLGISNPDILGDSNFPRTNVMLNHTDLLTAQCRPFPNPSRWTIPIAAVASDLIAT